MDDRNKPDQELTSRMRIGAPPPFHELDEYVFQDLCAELLAKEPSVYFSEVYGERGQRQDGIDLWAWRWEGTSSVTLVGQCKCYQDFEPREIKAASDEFFAHWDSYWRYQDVKVFVLFVASEFRTTQRIKAVNEQKRRFEEKGIRYEPWPAGIIRGKLRHHPEIIRTYIKEDTETWVRRICGESLAMPTSPSAETGYIQVARMRLISEQLDALREILSGEIEGHYEQARTAFREGRSEELMSLVRQVQTDDVVLGALSPHRRAKLLRLAASVEMAIASGLPLGGKTLLAIRHMSRESIPEKAILSHLPADLAGYTIVEITIDQTKLFKDGRLVDPLQAVKQQFMASEQINAYMAAHPAVEVAYYGIAHIPLLFLAGYMLSTKARVRLFDHNRQDDTWDLLQRGGIVQPLKVTGLPLPQSDETGEVVIRVAMSFRILSAAVSAIVPAPLASITLEVPDRGIDTLISEQQVREYGATFRRVLDQIHDDLPNASRVHVFCAVPAPVAFQFGRQIVKNIHPKIIVYNYVATDNPQYSWGLDLTASMDAQELLVRPTSTKE